VAEVPEMERGRFSKPRRHGDEVHRYPAQENTEIHRLLRHFESKGCALTPRYLGVAADGAERLTFIAGATGYPPLSDDIRSDDALVSVARAIREVHDTSLDFEMSVEAPGQRYEIAGPNTIDCIGHNDLAPWNMVFDGTDVRGIIDWDTARPSTRVWDLSYAAHQFVPFHPADDLLAWGWPYEPDRRRRLRLFLDSYGLAIDAHEIVDTAVIRLYGTGAYIGGEVARKNPAFEVHAEESHSTGFFKAAQSLILMRDSLV
jgi:hypothetical protein